MKTNPFLRFIALVIAATLFASSTQAVDRTWTGSVIDNDWNTPENWSADTKPVSGDRAVFNAAVAGGTVASAVAIQRLKDIRFDLAAGSITIGEAGNSRTLRLDYLGTMEMQATLAGSNNTITFNTLLELRSNVPYEGPIAYTINNNNTNASNIFAIAGGVTAAETDQGGTLTLGGVNTGDNIISGDIDDGLAEEGLAVTKSGTGKWILSGVNTFSAGLNINAGVLRLDSAAAAGSGNIKFGGGTLQYGVGNTTDYSGKIKNSGSAIMIDVNGQNVTFAELDANNTRGLTLADSAATAGTLTLSGSHAYSGTTTVNRGTLSVTGTMTGTGALVVGGKADGFKQGVKLAQEIIESGGAKRKLAELREMSNAF